MSLAVLITPEAEQALWENARWWAEHRSSEQAQRWYAGFAEAIMALGDHPHKYPLAHENDQFPYDVRVMSYGVGSRATHRALYTIRPDSAVVLSIRATKQRDASADG